ncbi:MAG: hypothetical protein H0X42_13325 [Solirubrobacterales bacterium]|nr:hypothetical protein [Solirubrobacterales bacterium]
MHEQDKSDPDFTTDAEDREAQVRVLRFLLGESPALVTEKEIAGALAGGLPVFVETDSIERALIELLGAGLIYRQGEFFFPTRAARYTAWLEKTE